MFVFIYIPPIFSVLLTISLKSTAFFTHPVYASPPVTPNHLFRGYVDVRYDAVGNSLATSLQRDAVRTWLMWCVNASVHALLAVGS